MKPKHTYSKEITECILSDLGFDRFINRDDVFVCHSNGFLEYAIISFDKDYKKDRYDDHVYIAEYPFDLAKFFVWWCEYSENKHYTDEAIAEMGYDW